MPQRTLPVGVLGYLGTSAARLEIFDCPRPNLAPILPFYVVAQTVSVSPDRRQMAGALGPATDFPSLESGREHPPGASVWAASRAERRDARGAAATEVLSAGYVSLSIRSRTSCRASRGLYRYRHSRPLQTCARFQRAPPDGVGRLRAARRAIRPQDRPASAQDHGSQCRHFQATDPIPGIQLRLDPGIEHHRPGLFQVDPVDLSPAVQRLVQPTDQSRRADKFA